MADEDWEKEEVPESDLLAVLADAIEALDAADVPHVLIGGIPSAIFGRPRETNDVDFFVTAETADRALEALADAGFDTKKEEDDWLYKAKKKDVLIDVIFKAEKMHYLDDEMLERAVTTEWKGQRVKLVPPEDLLVMKVAAHEEGLGHYWHDALAIIVSSDIDWDYLVRKAELSARRVLSLLVYAQSTDLHVPDEPVRQLFKRIYGH